MNVLMQIKTGPELVEEMELRVQKGGLGEQMSSSHWRQDRSLMLLIQVCCTLSTYISGGCRVKG